MAINSHCADQVDARSAQDPATTPGLEVITVHHAPPSSCAEPSAATICAVIVTFDPDAGFTERCRVIAAQVARVVIVDNGSGPETMECLLRLEEAGTVHLIRNPGNRGVATALNQGIEWARRQEFLWALLFDHDTVPDRDLVETLAALWQGLADRGRVAVVGANYRDAATGRVASLVPASATDPYQEVVSIITSGSLIAIEAYTRLGGFRDDLFIDHIDDDYCLRARALGYAVLLTCAPLMTHSLGEITIHRILGRRPGTSNHSPTRRYYMSRNLVVLLKEHGLRERGWARHMVGTRLRDLLLLLLFERNKMVKLRSIAAGVRDGMLGRLGPAPDTRERRAGSGVRVPTTTQGSREEMRGWE